MAIRTRAIDLPGYLHPNAGLHLIYCMSGTGRFTNGIAQETNTMTPGGVPGIWNATWLPQVSRGTPQNLTITPEDDADAAWSIKVYGENQFGEPVSETFSGLWDGVAVTGTKIFRMVRRIETVTNAAAGSSKTMSIGHLRNGNARYGLPFKLRDVNVGIEGSTEYPDVEIRGVVYLDATFDTDWRVDAENSSIYNLGEITANPHRLVKFNFPRGREV